MVPVVGLGEMEIAVAAFTSGRTATGGKAFSILMLSKYRDAPSWLNISNLKMEGPDKPITLLISTLSLRQSRATGKKLF